jgi:16S rRNA (guanine527-N7)-methyltransferase
MNKPHDYYDVFSNVSRETLEKLEKFVELLMIWNKKINLIAGNCKDEIWQRHILDSYQLAKLLPAEKSIVDIGSGGGFPAIIIAICYDYKKMTLIESDKRKAIFLQQAIMELDLKNIIVMNQRCENISSIQSDVVTARAISSIDELLKISAHHLNDKGEMWLLKGKNAEAEIILAKSFQFCYELINNPLSDGFITRIFEIKKRDV